MMTAPRDTPTDVCMLSSDAPAARAKASATPVLPAHGGPRRSAVTGEKGGGGSCVERREGEGGGGGGRCLKSTIVLSVYV
jgi:hypothetical protein